MTQYISKAAIVAEIKEKLKYANDGITYAQSGVSRGLKEYNIDLNAWQHCQSMCEQILSFLDTLEVKEVDLNESARHYLLHEHISPLNEVLHQADLRAEMQYHKDIEDAYKAGFMLGLKTKKGE